MRWVSEASSSSVPGEPPGLPPLALAPDSSGSLPPASASSPSSASAQAITAFRTFAVLMLCLHIGITGNSAFGQTGQPRTL